MVLLELRFTTSDDTMPRHSDFERVFRQMVKDYGKKKGEEVYYSWLTKHKYDDTEPMDKQKSKAEGASEVTALLEAFSAKVSSISVPAYKTHYTAYPKDPEVKDGPIEIRAITLEEGANVNNWRVVKDEFPRVAAQYKEGRQLRLNHDKTVQSVIGKSFDSAVLKGSEVEAFLGRAIEGINPDELYVGTKFEANPQDPQVRTNILSGYVETGSIGLDAEAFCDECDEPLELVGGAFERTCHHLSASIKLKNTEVKEYSYVAEPAFEHSFAFPSFSAAVSDALNHSPFTNTPPTPKTDTEMVDAKVTEIPKVEATAKAIEHEKEDEKEDVEARATAIAEKMLAMYKQGVADAVKHYKMEADAEPKPKVEATAAEVKTDQITQSAPAVKPEPAKPDFLARAYEPMRFWAKDLAVKELLVAASKAERAPASFRARVKEVYG